MTNKTINTPIKIQGKKRNIIPFLQENIKLNSESIYIEPFLGSAVVAFNLIPQKAILSDVNYHIINFYKNIQNGLVNPKVVREFLEEHGKHLELQGESYYYEMRNKFNDIIQVNNNDYYVMLANGTDITLLSLYFIFLNTSCFNGTIRFNSKGLFNTPFCRKPEKFSKAYITKIVNSIENVANILKDKDWDFVVAEYQEILNLLNQPETLNKFNISKEKLQSNNEFIIYLDPPYIDTHNNYYCKDWLQTEEDLLYQSVLGLIKNHENIKIYLSNWLQKTYPKIDKYENNIIMNQVVIDTWLQDNTFNYYSTKHKYMIASKTTSRMDVEEILIYNV